MIALAFIIEIIDKIISVLALCFGIFFIPYSFYDFCMFFIVKFRYWRNRYENRKNNRND